MLSKKELMTGNEAAAWAARLARAEVIPNYPITPQTECIETIAKWVANGEFNTEFLRMDSEHSVMSAAVGASATGTRVFTATSSQGLLLMFEEMYIASGMRLPIVMANMSRGLSAPITLWSDHNDFLTLLNSGWLMLNAQDNQEVIDSLIMSFKISEDKNVLLPSVVNLDGYILSYTVEPTILPAQNQVDKFLGKYNSEHASFVKKVLIQGAAVLRGNDYTYFKKQQNKAAFNALDVIEKTNKEWKKLTGREYGFVEEFMTNDAEIILVTQGSISTNAKSAVMKMRAKGARVGLLRLRVIRPFPRDAIRNALWKAKGIAVIDKNLCPGRGGIMYAEIRDALYEHSEPIISNYILGLGGTFEKQKDYFDIVAQTQKDVKNKKGGIRFVQ